MLAKLMTKLNVDLPADIVKKHMDPMAHVGKATNSKFELTDLTGLSYIYENR